MVAVDFNPRFAGGDCRAVAERRLNRGGLVPQIALVVIDSVALQQRQEFFLVR
jgi:hypothetical protein